LCVALWCAPFSQIVNVCWLASASFHFEVVVVFFLLAKLPGWFQDKELSAGLLQSKKAAAKRFRLL
jgi:hypothetical protein